MLIFASMLIFNCSRFGSCLFSRHAYFRTNAYFRESTVDFLSTTVSHLKWLISHLFYRVPKWMARMYFHRIQQFDDLSGLVKLIYWHLYFPSITGFLSWNFWAQIFPSDVMTKSMMLIFSHGSKICCSNTSGEKTTFSKLNFELIGLFEEQDWK